MAMIAADSPLLLKPNRVNLADFRASGGTSRARLIDVVGDGLKRHGLAELFDSEFLTPDLIRDVRQAMDWLFAFSDAELAPFECPEAFREVGFCPFGVEKHEGTDIANAMRYWHCRLTPARYEHWQREYAKRGYHTRNIWPLLGKEDDHVFFFRTITRLFEPISQFGEMVAEILEVLLDAPPGAIKETIQGGESIFRFVDYPPRRVWPLGQFVRNYKHVDSCLFTLLFMAWLMNDVSAGSQAARSALKVELNGVWTPVNASPDAALLNPGAIGELLSGGKFLAVKHRVDAPDDLDHWRRIFTAFFHQRPWVPVTTFPSCLKSGQEALPTVSAEEARNRFLRINYRDDHPALAAG